MMTRTVRSSHNKIRHRQRDEAREVEEILGMNGLPLPLEMIDIDLDELQESQPEKIAAAKARLAAEACGGPAIVDDTSLCLNAIGGMPGPTSVVERWEALRLLTDMMISRPSRSRASPSRRGRAPCLLFFGRVQWYHCAPRAVGLGWDAVFQPEGSAETFAEMSGEGERHFPSLAGAGLAAQHRGDRDCWWTCVSKRDRSVFLEDRVHYRETWIDLSAYFQGSAARLWSGSTAAPCRRRRHFEVRVLAERQSNRGAELYDTDVVVISSFSLSTSRSPF